VWTIFGAICNCDLWDEVFISCKKNQDNEISEQDSIQKFQDLQSYIAHRERGDMAHDVPERVSEAIENWKKGRQ